MRPTPTVLPHALARRAALFAIAALVLTFGVSAGPASAATDPITQVLQRTNDYRVNHGLKPLTLRTGIVEVSQGWSGYMKSTRTLAHNPNFVSQMPSGAYSAAENVGYACGYGGKAKNSAVVMNAWLKSSGHEANITGNFTHIGIGIAYDSTRDCAWSTQNFGKYPLAFSYAPRPSVVGELKVGNVVSARTGTWRPSPTLTYRWFRDGVRIEGATGKRYTLRWADRGHYIKVKVTAKRSGYQTTVRTSKAVRFG